MRKSALVYVDFVFVIQKYFTLQKQNEELEHDIFGILFKSLNKILLNTVLLVGTDSLFMLATNRGEFL